MLAGMLHGPLGDGLGAVSGVATDLFRWVQAGLGPIVVVLGGGRAAWQAAHGKDFTGELIAAIGGVGLVAAAGWSALSAQVGATAGETLSSAHTVGVALGGIVTVIGGSWTAWKLVHREKATSHLVCAIVGVCIAAVSAI